MRLLNRSECRLLLLLMVVLSTCVAARGQGAPPQSPDDLPELSRAARPWEFADAVGQRAALLGQENGSFEAWVYPLKILSNLHLRFHVDEETIDGRALVRSIQTRPESTTITYAYDSFRVTERLFVPVGEPGAVIAIEIDATRPVQVEAVFDRDFQLEWPGAMGASDIEWNAALHAFAFDEDQRKFTALVGSPSSAGYHLEFATNYTEATQNSLTLETAPVGHSTRLIAIAASFQGLPPVEVTYRKLCASWESLLASSVVYYRRYLNEHTRVQLPDAQLQSAYEWAQISVLQGLVTNPYLGTGLIAGYDRSGSDGRPGFDWFFGRDALWTSLALDAEGDFSTTRTALAFLARYQRQDGKITHEISQSASFVPWFDAMPYAYAAADATPLFLVVMDDYLRRSGDTAFVEEHWDNLRRAQQFLQSTYDPNGFPRNLGVGHGWIEGGPLLPVKNELYQASVAVEAWHAWADLARTLHHDAEAAPSASRYSDGKSALNQAFWIAEKKRYAFALDEKNAQVDAPSVLATVPMWFGLLDADKAKAMIAELARPELQTDWGMRILASDHAKYDAAGYHSGSVWPLFTGWAATGEYRYHEALPAFANLRANALLTFDGSLGHVVEVLSGNYYQPLSMASPHQIWSSAMVISPLLTGLFGLETDAFDRRVTLRPHLPADWTWFAMQHLKAGPCDLSIRFAKTLESMTYTIVPESGAGCRIELSPAISLRAEVSRVDRNGSKISFQVGPGTQGPTSAGSNDPGSNGPSPKDVDQHVTFALALPDTLSAPTVVTIHLRNDFGVSQQAELPALGSGNDGLRIVSQSWSEARDTLTLDVASAGSGSYELSLWNPGQVAGVDGGTLNTVDAEHGRLQITIAPHAPGTTAHQRVVLHFVDAARHSATRR